MTLLLVLVVSLASAQDSTIREIEEKVEQLELELDNLQNRSSGNSDRYLSTADVQWGRGWGMETGGGLMGSGALATLGLQFPGITFGKDEKEGVLGFSLKISMIADSTPVRVFNEAGLLLAEDNRFHFVAGPSVTLGSPLFQNSVRLYGGADVQMGTMFTETNSYSANIFMGALFYGGLEVYTSRYVAFFMECGGGGGGHIIAGDNPFAGEKGYLGGAFIRSGCRVFF